VRRRVGYMAVCGTVLGLGVRPAISADAARSARVESPRGRRRGPVGRLAATGSKRGAAALGMDDGVRPNGAPARGDVAEAVVTAAGRGDHAAFAAIVEHYDDRLRALAFHVLGGADDLDDAMQEAYVKAYRGLASFRGSSALGTWLHRITYTTCLNVLRSRARRPEPADPQIPDQAAVEADLGQAIAGADAFERLLAGLSLEQRAAVVLVDTQGYAYSEAAAILGIPPGTVASRLSSAHARLRTALDSEDVCDSGAGGPELMT
jgi:RNA polymerase sigma-70 factor, ECF subfamily